MKEISDYLENIACRRGIVSYQDIVKKFGLPKFNGCWNGHPLCDIFGQIDKEDADKGRPFRTSVVISQENNRPGNGYFKALCDMKGIVSSTDAERDSIWSEQLKAVHAYNWRICNNKD